MLPVYRECSELLHRARCRVFRRVLLLKPSMCTRICCEAIGSRVFRLSPGGLRSDLLQMTFAMLLPMF